MPRPTLPVPSRTSHGCKRASVFALLGSILDPWYCSLPALSRSDLLTGKDNVAFHFNENYFVYLSWKLLSPDIFFPFLPDQEMKDNIIVLIILVINLCNYYPNHHFDILVGGLKCTFIPSYLCVFSLIFKFILLYL